MNNKSSSYDETVDEKAKCKVYLPGQPLNDGEELVCDQTAYVMLHQAQTGSPCLSFDIIKDNLGNHRETYPLTAFIVAGTQAQAHTNSVIVMKLSNLHPTNKESCSEEDSEDEEEDEVNVPEMTARLIKHQGGINRIRCTKLNETIVAATWSELGKVYVWDLSLHLRAINNPESLKTYTKDNVGSSVSPLFAFSGHQQEGFALDWNSTNPGVLATGDCRMDIHIWHPREAGRWLVDQRPLVGHTESIEDLQWSPNEPTVLASCSVDKSIRIWDVRAPPSKACMLTTENAHTSDVNIISWNHNEPFIVSGGDDGYLHVWDLRRFQDKTPLGTFKHHTEPITTINWHPSESSVFASGGGDDQIALWDLSVEEDKQLAGEEIEGLPPQLLFIHQGQKILKNYTGILKYPALL